jgi:hypothetical protein
MQVYLPLFQLNDDGGDWVEILSEDFEGDFPGPWVVVDKNGEQGGIYFWEKSDCRAASGSNSGWAIRGGREGEKLDCFDHYPVGVYSWMTYGPFSLTAATSAELRFKRWVNTPGELDSLQYLASIDNNRYEGYKQFNPAPEWRETVLDLTEVPVLGDLTGQPQVWIRFVFETKDLNSLPEGAYVDDIVLRKWVHVPRGPQTR